MVSTERPALVYALLSRVSALHSIVFLFHQETERMRECYVREIAEINTQSAVEIAALKRDAAMLITCIDRFKVEVQDPPELHRANEI